MALVLVATACDGKSGDGKSGDDTDTEGTNPGECSDSADNDSDGDYDCDDSDCAGTPDCEEADTGTSPVDADGDGVPVDEDCDDTDASSTVTAEDADCDGVLTTDDCDDSDPGLPADDADCDGVLTADDCDDADASVGLPDVDDPDCDGVPTHAGGGTMVLIPAGSFDMGCGAGQSDCYGNESPVMPVTLTHDYYMGETELTQAEYEAVMGINPSHFSSCGTDCPVENVTWYMAAVYANVLSTAAGLTECYTCSGSGDGVVCDVAMSPYDCNGYRLPTEAEWEGAARCGDNWRHAGSNHIHAVGWIDANSGSTPQPVAGKDPNACGLYDMSGNVWEWTQDIALLDYTADGRTDPEGATAGPNRTVRGGSWLHPASGARVATRGGHNTSDYYNTLGFRLARTLP